MKIAMIGQKGIPAKYGGVERHVHDLAVHVEKCGHNVTVYARKWYTAGNDEFIDGIRIVHVPTIRTKHLDTIAHTLFATIAAVREGYDVIHYHAVGPSLLSWIPRIFSPKTKVVTTFHCIDRYHQKWGWFARFMLRLGEWTACRFAHETVTVSQSLRQYCANEFQTSTTYIPNAITVPTENVTEQTIKQFGLTKNQYIVMVSRLVPHKGAHLLIDAFIRLKGLYREENIQKLQLAIVGGSAYTDAYVEMLHKKAKGRDDIIFTGFQSGETLEALYANADALVHPSMNEGLPLTVLQAMAHARPVLLSNIPEHVELKTHKRFLFMEDNTDAIVETIADFVRCTNKEKTSMGMENRETVRTNYTWDHITPQILDVYMKRDPKQKMVLVEGTV